jgi:hypothetical protein
MRASLVQFARRPARSRAHAHGGLKGLKSERVLFQSSFCPYDEVMGVEISQYGIDVLSAIVDPCAR